MIAMRADGKISKDEYQAMRSPVKEKLHYQIRGNRKDFLGT